MSSGVAPSFVSKCSPGVQQLLVDPAVTMAAVEARLIAPYLAVVEDTKLSADQVAAAVAELGIPHSATAGSPAYGLSKACVNAYTIELARFVYLYIIHWTLDSREPRNHKALLCTVC